MNHHHGVRILGNLVRNRAAVCLVLALGLLAGLTGCTRNFFRKAADEEVEGVLAEKDTDPCWKIEQFHVYPDPRARFADPTDPDHPPMPPDDCAAFARSPHPQQPYHAGVGYVRGTGWLKMLEVWDAENRTERQAADEAERKKLEEQDGKEGGEKENKDEKKDEKKDASGGGTTDVARHPVATYFDEPLRSKEPGYLLKLDQAVEMGVINSPEYQTFREQLYETALPVTQQRFNFAYQWAASEDWIRHWAGPLATGGGSGSSASRSTTTSNSTSGGSSTTTSNSSSNAGASGTSSSSSTSTTSTNGAGATTANSPTSSTTAGATTPSPNGNNTGAGGTGSTTSSTTTTSTGSAPTAVGTNNWTGISTVSFSKLFSTGALLTFDFVNTNIFNFAPPKDFTSFSTINLNITQPLLQGGGRAVTLEPLTQTERQLFYAIRAYARFREQFYVSVAIGASLPGSLNTAAGSGTGTNPISALAALGIASTDVSGGFVGYLSTLYRECDMAADKKLVADLERALRIYEGYQEGGQFSPLQVAQVRSTLLSAQNTVLVDQQNANNALDQFKLLLGMPANLPLILEDTPAREITRQFDRYYAIISDSDAAYKEIERQEDLAPDRLRAALARIFSRGPLVRGTDFARKIPESWKNWARLTDRELEARLEKLRDQRRKQLDLKTDVELKGRTLSDKEARDLRDSEIESDLGGLEQILRRYETKAREKGGKEATRNQERLKIFRLVAYSAEVVLVWARNERFEAVAKLWPELPKAPLPCPPVDGEDLDLSSAEPGLAQQEAVRFALNHRWDLMNARAQNVDAWRQLRVTANALMGAFNVQYNLQSSTPVPGSRPFAFSTDRTSSTLSLDTQLPLNRLAQRNTYRAALINYQEQRRALMTLEDNIAAQVRFDVRQLQLFGANYRIQKRTLEALYSQVESALELITAPADPSALQASGTAGQANAAALTTQYLNALSSLNNAQTRMYDIWLSYLATRMQLYLDLESLKMDKRGVWIMENDYLVGKDGSRPGSEIPAPLPIPLQGGQAREGELLPLPRVKKD